MRDLEYPSERIAWAAWQLARGERFTARDLAQRTGLTRSGAHQLLLRVSGAIPIVTIGSDESGQNIWAAMDADDDGR